MITARDKEISHYLLNYYKIEFVSRGKGKNSMFGKILYMFYADTLLYKYANKFKPDLFMSFSTIYPSHVAFIKGLPYIGITDTEHAKEQHLLFKPFSKVILTPSSFKRDFGKKQIRFNGYMELCYLHPKYFTPDPSILDLLGITKDEKYVIMRFVSWNASHDVGQSGLSFNMKKKTVSILSKYGINLDNAGLIYIATVICLCVALVYMNNEVSNR